MMLRMLRAFVRWIKSLKVGNWIARISWIQYIVSTKEMENWRDYPLPILAGGAGKNLRIEEFKLEGSWDGHVLCNVFLSGPNLRSRQAKLSTSSQSVVFFRLHSIKLWQAFILRSCTTLCRFPISFRENRFYSFQVSQKTWKKREKSRQVSRTTNLLFFCSNLISLWPLGLIFNIKIVCTTGHRGPPPHASVPKIKFQ